VPNDNCVTIAQALKPAGCFTAMSGKWHVGEKDGPRPISHGFDRYYGTTLLDNSHFSVLRHFETGKPSQPQRGLTATARGQAGRPQPWVCNSKSSALKGAPLHG
jgi:arylsulfatase A-like enzyme